MIAATLVAVGSVVVIARSLSGSSPAETTAEAEAELVDPEERFSVAGSIPKGSGRTRSSDLLPVCTHETFDRLMSRLRGQSIQGTSEMTGKSDIEVVAEAVAPYSPAKLFEDRLGLDACHTYMAVLQSPSSGERWTVLKDEQGAPLCGLDEALFWWNVYYDQAEQSDYISGDLYRPALESLAACYVTGTTAEKKGDVEVLGLNFAGLGNFEATIWRPSQKRRFRLVVKGYRTEKWEALDADRREDLGKEIAEKGRQKLIIQLADNDWHVPGGEVEVLDAEGSRDNLRATVRSKATGKRFRVEVKDGKHVWTMPLD